jgi:hypothetical protein
MTTEKRHGKRKSEKSDDMMSMPLGEHEELIVPFLMEFLDVSTLVLFGSTTRKNQVHLSEEVARRKSRFKAIQHKISNELLSAENIMPSRDTVNQALNLRQEACRLIDSGLGRVDHKPIDFTNVCRLCSRDRLFANERKLLNGHRSGNAAEDLLMLPAAFYLSRNLICERAAIPNGTPPPSEEAIKRVTHDLLGYLVYLAGARGDRREGDLLEYVTCSPFFEDGMLPLRIFSHKEADCYTQTVDQTAERIVIMGQLEAFRIAARRFVKENPHALSCLLVTLILADRLVPPVMAARARLILANHAAGRGGEEVAPVLIFSDYEKDLWWSDEELN